MIRKPLMANVILAKEFYSESAKAAELHCIEQMLGHIQQTAKWADVVEVADLNKFRFIQKPAKIRQALQDLSPDKAFVFVLHKC
ncbi:hypothetical protein [Phnomibacter sp. MR]|uniref:hypothetical protein n=1 Tax=Phnomibacter sp. MR TaxID=3042318 RepID=UPI003A7F6560